MSFSSDYSGSENKHSAVLPYSSPDKKQGPAHVWPTFCNPVFRWVLMRECIFYWVLSFRWNCGFEVSFEARQLNMSELINVLCRRHNKKSLICFECLSYLIPSCDLLCIFVLITAQKMPPLHIWGSKRSKTIKWGDYMLMAILITVSPNIGSSLNALLLCLNIQFPFGQTQTHWLIVF